MTLSDALAAGEAIPEAGSQVEPVIIHSDSEEEVSGARTESDSVAPESPQVTTRSGRKVKKTGGINRSANLLQIDRFFM